MRMIDPDDVYLWYSEHFPDMDPDEAHFSINDIRGNANLMDYDLREKSRDRLKLFKDMNSQEEIDQKIDQIRSIVHMPHIQEDVIRYKMICELLNIERGIV